MDALGAPKKKIASDNQSVAIFYFYSAPHLHHSQQQSSNKSQGIKSRPYSLYALYVVRAREDVRKFTAVYTREG